jgi:ribosomal-protein-alanine N-acetyltransferase
MMAWFNLFARSDITMADATSRDSAAIAALHAASFHRGWSAEEVDQLLIDRRRVTAHRALAGGKLVGFIMTRLIDHEAEILSVAVAANAQGRGIAGKLLALHLRRLVALGARAVFLEVDAQNKPALRLYDRAGFREVSRRPNYYAGEGGKKLDALVLRRDLG